MRYVSLCSGVEATTVAWSRLGWQPLAFAEIDPFACAVLAHRFPDVPNLGDVCNIDWEEFHERNGIVDILFGSTPCQSFSVAGNRLGLSGESRIMLEFVRAAKDLVRVSRGASPRYVLWENVPGSLSSGPKGQKGEDFGCLLRELAECGFGLSWRVLDSQFTRVHDWSSGGLAGPVPQRRRRVYLVGSLGTDGSCEILFERSCLRGNHPKGRKAREALAERPAGSPGASRVAGVMTTANMGSANGGSHNTDGVSYTLDGTNSNAVLCIGSVESRAAIDEDLCGTLNAGHEQPIVIDRAAFNQGANAQYPPHIEETDLMDALVARGPHAVCYRTGTT